jgi:hypothetical protein
MTVSPFDYLASRDDADELIQEFGQAVSVRIVTDSGADPSEPTQTTSDKATYAAIVAYSKSQIDGKDILRTDRRAYVAAGPLAALGVTDFDTTARLVVGGVPITIMQVDPINPAGTVVAYDVQIRL